MAERRKKTEMERRYRRVELGNMRWRAVKEEEGEEERVGGRVGDPKEKS